MSGPRAAALNPVRTGAPWAVALVALVLASGFVWARLQLVADGDIGVFVVAGSQFADGDAPPQGIPVIDGPGYDGQFFWRLAHDPAQMDEGYHHGLRIDTPFRAQRLGYPTLAWVLTGGGRASVAWALVLINVAALGGLAALAAAEARRHGHTGWLGLSAAFIPGFLFSTARDLSEPMAGVLLLAALLALRRERWGWAAAGFSLAVLTREQIVAVVAVYGLSRLWPIVRRRARLGLADLPWALPAAAFLLLQAVVFARTGTLPAKASGGGNTGLPLVHLVPGIGDWLQHDPWVEHPEVGGRTYTVLVEQVRALPELALMVGLVAAALTSRLPRSWRWEQAAVVLLALVAVSLSGVVWAGPADLRTIADLAVLCWAIALAGSSRRVLTAIGIATPLVALLPAWGLLFVR